MMPKIPQYSWICFIEQVLWCFGGFSEQDHGCGEHNTDGVGHEISRTEEAVTPSAVEQFLGKPGRGGDSDGKGQRLIFGESRFIKYVLTAERKKESESDMLRLVEGDPRVRVASYDGRPIPRLGVRLVQQPRPQVRSGIGI
jgi:hypothetical protein